MRMFFLGFVLLCMASTLQAGPLANRRAQRANERNASSTTPPLRAQQGFNVDRNAYNPAGTPLGPIQRNWVERQHQRDLRTSERTGQSWQQVEAQRARRIQTFGQALGGFADGVSAGVESSQWGGTAPTATGSSNTGNRGALQWQQNQFNRNYSRNPDHAPVFRGR